jgi:hypothetical protein
MAVVAGVVFFTVRALLALIPGLTVSFPIKKWSAAARRASCYGSGAVFRCGNTIVSFTA